MPDEYCELTDLPQSMCAHCHPEKEESEPIPNLKVEGSIVAKFDGRCGVCEEYTIREGDTIYRVLYPGEKTIVWAGSCCVKDGT